MNSVKLDTGEVEEIRKGLYQADATSFAEEVSDQQEAFIKEFDRLAAKREEDSKEGNGLIFTTDPLAMHIRNIFDDRSRDRSLLEEKWLDALRQYRGEYAPEVLDNMPANRSKAYVRFTRTKHKTMSSRLMDMLFPANGDKNWGIKPTPVPESDPNKLRLLKAQWEEQTGQPITEEQILLAAINESKQAADAMSREMADQLADLRFRDIIKGVVDDGCLYGTGVLKGPQVRLKNNRAYIKDSETGEWVNIETETIKPYCEHVSIWDFYPDMTAKTIDNCRNIIQRHEMDKSKLVALANRIDFDRDAINQHLLTSKDGDLQKKSFETQLDTMGGVQSANSSARNPQKYEVLEFWGYIDANDLRMLGVDIPEKNSGVQELKANVWVLGNRIIKATLDPMDTDYWPYFLFYGGDKDETSIFGEGIAAIVKDMQDLMNAAFRAMFDNAAISAGPQVEVNVDLLGPEEDYDEILPFKVWPRTGTGLEAQTEAIRVHTIPSYTNEFQNMINIVERFGDEVSSIPRFMHGGDTQGIGGAGRTMGGMSMMMGNANVTIKDQVKNFDEGITKPFISALYDWNMQFNNKPEIKGDFDIIALGTASLIAKEVRSDNLIQFAQMTANPTDAAIVERPTLFREIAKCLDLQDEGFIKSPEQMAVEQQQAAADAKDREQFAMHITETARAGGFSPEDLLNRINMLFDEVKATQQMVAQMQGGGNVQA